MTDRRSEPARPCARCGSLAVAGRFCSNCGARRDGADPSPSPTPPAGSSAAAPPPERSGRPSPEPVVHRPPLRRRAWRRLRAWRTPLVVLPLLAALLVAAGTGARMLLAEVPEPAEPADPVTCWDGTQAAPEECSLPRGVAGLRWVFPSFSPRDPGCRQLGAGWRCATEYAGSPVVVTYRQLPGVRSGRAALVAEQDGVPRTLVRADNGEPARFEWRRELPDRTGFEVTSMYVAFPYAVQLRAEGRAVRDSAFEGLVRFRSPAAISYR